jgi:hypothetical protein
MNLFRERPNLFGQTALMPSGLVAVNDALVHHAVDDRCGVRERGGGVIVLAGFERESRLADGAAQLRSQSVVAGAVRGRLSGSFFSRFRIRQAETPRRTIGTRGDPQKSRVFSGSGARLSMRQPARAT